MAAAAEHERRRAFGAENAAAILDPWLADFNEKGARELIAQKTEKAEAEEAEETEKTKRDRNPSVYPKRPPTVFKCASACVFSKKYGLFYRHWLFEAAASRPRIFIPLSLVHPR